MPAICKCFGMSRMRLKTELHSGLSELGSSLRETASHDQFGNVDRANRRSRTASDRSTALASVVPMDKQQLGRRIPKIQFRVLIMGKVNAGKTTILQKICGTTDSPIFYRENVWRQEEGILDPSVNGFIRRKCRERRLEDRLHAIWYCVPMDNRRPQLDLKYFKDICPDRNVPVIVVFTKYDLFLRYVQMHVEDFGSPDDNVSDVAEKLFQEHYLHPLGDDVRFVRLEKMHRRPTRCDALIETTGAALNEDIVGLMLLAVQRDNLGLCVKTALNRVHTRTGTEVKHTVRECLTSFPYIWVSGNSLKLEYMAHDA
ncbi:hypothetical protein EDB86DRAFT_1350778 [Lactarius hatsudake]|nr:hypothetical protein EDB86DRAFT_1350778 [Lactarius hatsudake]